MFNSFLANILDNASFWDTDFETAVDAHLRFQSCIPEDEVLELTAVPHPTALAFSR